MNIEKIDNQGMDNRYFSLKLAEWYQLHKRTLPCGKQKILISYGFPEIILQQTA